MYSNSPDPTEYNRFFNLKRLSVVAAILLVITAGTFTFSKTANAGLLSFLGKIMGNQEVSAQLREPRAADSQTSPLVVLQAHGNPIPLAYATDIPPFENGSLLSPDLAHMNATSTEPLNTQISIYVVRSGDTISTVAKMFDVSVNTILWANNITSRSTLQPGQTLVILPVTGITHTISRNDTIESIAKKYKADVNDILNYNDLTISSTLKIGDKIIIPDGEGQASSVSSSARKLSTPAYPGYYACPVPGSRVSQKIHGNNGVDLAAPIGTPVYAAAGGTVIINRSNGAWNGGYGNFIVVLHANGSQTLYSHMSRGTVVSGESVSKNQLVGYVGMTGLTTGPHLHFEVRGAQNPFSNPSLCR